MVRREETGGEGAVESPSSRLSLPAPSLWALGSLWRLPGEGQLRSDLNFRKITLVQRETRTGRMDVRGRNVKSGGC